MKKLFKVGFFVLTILVISLSLMISVSAASYDHCADALNEMGLFNGTANGYELDRAPTRAEAAAMLVRLLGAEDEAQALTYDAPFTDLADWQKPYVQYLYEKGLTSGVSETSYAPDNLCTAQMYSTFLLRALGYSDANGDFTYAAAIGKAEEIGLVNTANCNQSNFLRDHVAAMSYTALSIAPKDGSADSLLEKLVAEDAIAADKAQATLDTFSLYNEFNAVNAVAPDENKIEMDSTTAIEIAAYGETMSMSMYMNIKTDMDPDAADNSKMSITGSSSMSYEGEAEESSFAYYYTGGVYYMDIAGEKVKMPLSFEEALAQSGVDSDTATVNSDPLCLIESISKNGETYTIVYAQAALSSLTEDVLASIDDSLYGGSSGMTVNNLSMQATFGADGSLSAMKITVSVSMVVTDPSLADIGMDSMDMDITMDIKIVATGSTVVIELPDDLDTYTDISDYAA